MSDSRSLGMTNDSAPGVWHKDGPLAQIEWMVVWVKRIADDDPVHRETLHKVVKNIDSAVAALTATEGADDGGA